MHDLSGAGNAYCTQLLVNLNQPWKQLAQTKQQVGGINWENAFDEILNPKAQANVHKKKSQNINLDISPFSSHTPNRQNNRHAGHPSNSQNVNIGDAMHIDFDPRTRNAFKNNKSRNINPNTNPFSSHPVPGYNHKRAHDTAGSIYDNVESALDAILSSDSRSPPQNKGPSQKSSDFNPFSSHPVPHNNGNRSQGARKPRATDMDAMDADPDPTRQNASKNMRHPNKNTNFTPFSSHTVPHNNCGSSQAAAQRKPINVENAWNHRSNP